MENQIKGLNNILISYVIELVNDDIKIDSDLYNIIDDLDCIKFIVFLEKTFNIKIDNTIAEKIFNQNNCTLENLKMLLKQNYNICDLNENRKSKILKLNNYR